MSYSGMIKLFSQVVQFNLFPNGKSVKLYSTGVYRINQNIFLKDWATLFKMLEEGNIKPIISNKFPILEASKANQLLESGQVVGNVVLLAPELI